MKGWLDKYQVGGQANKWQVSPKGVAFNKAARQPIKDIDAAASNALEKVTSYPQRKATELITGKNQYPAEAMGITNPLGVILANSILDPANLLGVGEVKAASKLLKGAKGAKKVTNVADNVMQHITQDELMDVFPTLTSSSNNMTDVQRATQRAELRRRMQGWDQEMNNTSTAVGNRSPMMGLTNLPGSSVTPSPAGGLMGLTPEEVTRTWENFVPMDFSSNWNLPKKTLLSKLKDKAGKAVNVVDKKLGEIVSPPRKLPKGVNVAKLSNEINEELAKGVGVKKQQFPLRIALSGDLDRLNAGTQIINPATNEIVNAGQISLSRLTKPYGSKKFSEILFPDKNPTSTTPRDVWSNTLGFAKETDFPFGNLPKDEQLMFHDLGISGEYNKAINEVLKRNDLGNVLSGGTGHTPLGLERWKKLANKGFAEDFGDKFYKLKKDGGWLEKYNDGGPIQPNYNDYSVSAGPGFEGDGYSNVGRNYSPAWGGQFQDGGELANVTVKGKRQPIVVTNPKDPRLKAYQDSLMYSNIYKYPKNPKKYNFEKWKPENAGAIDTGKRDAQDNHIYKLSVIEDEFSKQKMKPILRYTAKELNKNNDVRWEETNLLSGGTWESGVIFKKPTQPVIYRPEPTPQSTIDFMEGNYVQEPITETPQAQASAYGEVVDPRTGYTHMTRQGSAMYPMVGQNVPEMAMGGSIGGATQGIPGATGFMYARVSGSTPSKGEGRNKVYKTDASAENGKEMKFYQEGLDFKPKSISKNGSKVIKDNRGQWAHPGEITEIGSNQITMRDVPYPVMGISDTGDMQMMYPDEDYVYDGESVTEIPMMAQGGQLTKLDQLTNFTNYNTKQPGGWLDKYQ